MSPERIPEAIQLDPGAAATPPGLDAVLTELEPPILLLVGPDDDAAAKTAIALAEGRAAAGHPTVLADASGGEPRLNALLEVDNAEGMADLFLYGASPDRVRTRPPGRSFDFIPVGAYLPDDPALLDDDRWTALAAGLTDEGVGMLVFATPATPGLEALSRRLGRVVLIGDPLSIERNRDRIDPWSDVVAAVEPAGAAAPVVTDPTEPSRAEEVEEDEGLVAGEDPGAEDAFGAALADEFAGVDRAGQAGAEPVTAVERDRSPEEPARDEPWVQRASDESVGMERGEPPAVRSGSEERRAVSPVLWVLLVLALVAGAWFVYTEYLAAPASTTTAAEAAGEGESEPAPAERGEPVETPLPISVAVEAYPALAAGMERVDALRSAEPGVEFYLAPVDVEGVVYYRLLAGPVGDRESAERLMAGLVQAGHITAAESWAIQNTPLAFELGEYGSPAVAAARVDSLASMEVPAYVVAIRYDPGPIRFRVYGGAYETEAAAATMREILSDAGVEAELVTRTGEPVIAS